MTAPQSGDHGMFDQKPAGVSARPDLWSFSLSIYQSEGVPEACLYLQDELGGDVNILLFCLWVSAQGDVPVDTELLALAHDRVHAWRNRVVETLRQLRRDLKGGVSPLEQERVEAFRDRVKILELAAEREQQVALAAMYEEHSELLEAPSPHETPPSQEVVEERLAMGIDRYVETLTHLSSRDRGSSAQGADLSNESGVGVWKMHRRALITAAIASTD